MPSSDILAPLSLRRRYFGMIALALGAAAMTGPRAAVAQGPVLRGLRDIEGDAMAELAYLLGVEAYVYGFPLVMMDVTNGILTAASKSGEYSDPSTSICGCGAM
jgi:hypothetical protein